MATSYYGIYAYSMDGKSAGEQQCLFSKLAEIGSTEGETARI